MTVTLRRARPEEAAALGDIGFAAWAASAFAVADAGRVDRDKLRAEFRAFGFDYAATTLVAEADGVTLGWGAREDRDQRISDLWVGPEAQGRGVGRALLAALVEEIRVAGYPQAELETLASNAQAVGFYQRHGFGIVWRRDKFSPSLGYAIHKVGMSREVGSGR
jgi:ribosomal-protein-alanine N-acetyltransferase